jgi:hypothetical protein
MKAIPFMIALGEICTYYDGGIKPCTNAKGEKCPLIDHPCDLTVGIEPAEAEKMQSIVKKWLDRGKETNEAKFKEVFGITATEFRGLSDTNAAEWLGQKYETEEK